MRFAKLHRSCLLALALLGSWPLYHAKAEEAASTASAWQRIEASTPFIDSQGIARSPACSGGPMLRSGSRNPTAEPAETAFAFFIRPGDPKRLAIFWDGGGACWDDETCIGATLRGDSLYTSRITETPQTLAKLGGLADRANPANPLAGHTQVFIPYCTGDLFFGARESTYYGPDGHPWLIHHRGHDNVRAVLEYLANRYATGPIAAPHEIVLAGASAGGYGALYSLPAVAETFPQTTALRLLVDSADGVIGRVLYDAALGIDGAWGTRDNLSPVLQAAFDSGPRTLLSHALRDLGWRYQQARIGQYSRAFDAAQILFYNISRHPGTPVLWRDPRRLFNAALGWTVQTQAGMWRTANATWNYRFYLGAGFDHTLIANERFYSDNSASGVPVVEWFADMLNDPGDFSSDWRNLSCQPRCLPDTWQQLFDSAGN